MLKTRMKRIADQQAAAVRSLEAIETSIIALSNDDLLDLADIFGGTPRTPLAEMAFAEMANRGLSL